MGNSLLERLELDNKDMARNMELIKNIFQSIDLQFLAGPQPSEVGSKAYLQTGVQAFACLPKAHCISVDVVNKHPRRLFVTSASRQAPKTSHVRAVGDKLERVNSDHLSRLIGRALDDADYCTCRNASAVHSLSLCFLDRSITTFDFALEKG